MIQDVGEVKTLKRNFCFFGALVVVLTHLAGCQSTEPLYHHGQYNEFLYQYLSKDNYVQEEQIDKLLVMVEKAEARSKNVAPGIHASLGMLYFETGNPTQGLLHFEREKQLFPESIQFIDRLLARFKKGGNSVSG